MGLEFLKIVTVVVKAIEIFDEIEVVTVILLEGAVEAIVLVVEEPLPSRKHQDPGTFKKVMIEFTMRW